MPGHSQLIVEQKARLRVFASILLFGMISLLLMVAVADAQSPEDTITIAGRVINGTEGGEPPADLTVFALVIDEDAETIVERVESVTGPDGSFEMEVVSVDSGRFYRLVADDGVYTPFLDVLPADAGEEVTLTVYDRTTSLEEISVTTFSMVIPAIDEANGVLGVLAAVNLVNSGDEVYLADLADPSLTGFKLLRFNLPEGYQELTVESDLPSGNVMEISTGFAISNPVPPGEYSMVISYSAAFENGEFEYPLRLPFGAESVTILIPEGSGEITGMGLSRTETANIGDEKYVSYEGTNYELSTELGLRITGLPKPGVGDQFVEFLDSDQARIAIVLSVAIAMVAIVAYVIFVSRRRQLAMPTGRSMGEGVEDSARPDLVAAIAELDEMHELGKIEDSEYMVRRRQLVQQVIDSDAGGNAF